MSSLSAYRQGHSFQKSMKIFLSSLENGSKELIEQRRHFRWNLISYYYSRKANYKLAETIRDKSELILVDSGAHTLQKGTKVDYLKYTYEYAEFIKQFDRPNVIGYFEMDVDNILGYEKVLELRKILESVSSKIIPVWHKNRGIEEFKKMCQDYSGKIVAITGFKNEDIKDEQYLMFLKYAKKYNCKVHCLGMTRQKVLDRVPFDYTDSSSWKQQAIFGKIGNKKVTKEFSKNHRDIVLAKSYEEGEKMQERYFQKWRAYEE